MNPIDERASAGKWAEVGEVVGLQDGDASLGDRATFDRISVDPDEITKELVAAHSYLPADLFEGGRHTVRAQGAQPTLGVRAVAVDERAIDVEQHRVVVEGEA